MPFSSPRQLRRGPCPRSEVIRLDQEPVLKTGRGFCPLWVRVPRLPFAKHGTVAQLAEALGSEPRCWEFESPRCYFQSQRELIPASENSLMLTPATNGSARRLPSGSSNRLAGRSRARGRATRLATGSGWKPVERALTCLAGSTPAPSASIEPRLISQRCAPGRADSLQNCRTGFESSHRCLLESDAYHESLEYAANRSIDS